jgi:integrase
MVLPEPARTIVMTAGYTGLRKGELRGIRWEDYRDGQIHVSQSVWNGHTTEPKTRKSKAPVPIIKPLVDALRIHAEREGKPANGPIFRAGNGKPLNLDNIARRVIIPALQVCSVCRQAKADHKDGHAFELDKTLPTWHGWHSFRRGLATNLNLLGVDDKTIQAILRHSNIATTMNIYVKSVTEREVEAMQRLENVCLRAPSVQRVN